MRLAEQNSRSILEIEKLVKRFQNGSMNGNGSERSENLECGGTVAPWQAPAK